MRAILFAVLVIAIPTLALAQDEATDEKVQKDLAIRRELAKLDGVWELVSREIGGKPIPAEKLGKQTITFGSEVFIVRKGSDVIQFGINKIDPRKTPKIITTEVLGGEGKRDRLLGIYEWKDDTLRICSDPESDFRPKEFKTEPMSKQVLSVYRRVKQSPDEQIDIVGKYKTASREVDGKVTNGEAEIRKLGDSYIVQYRMGRQVGYVGIGIRQGKQLSVCWANRGEVGISVYTIEKGPKLVGGYAKLGGIGVLNSETLTPLEEID